MTAIGPVQYQGGSLAVPDARSVAQARSYLGGRPSLDAGQYHSFSFGAPTREVAEAKTRRFITQMNEVLGFAVLDYAMSNPGANASFAPFVAPHLAWRVDVVYVIEHVLATF